MRGESTEYLLRMRAAQGGATMQDNITVFGIAFCMFICWLSQLWTSF